MNSAPDILFTMVSRARSDSPVVAEGTNFVASVDCSAGLATVSCCPVTFVALDVNIFNALIYFGRIISAYEIVSFFGDTSVPYQHAIAL